MILMEFRMFFKALREALSGHSVITQENTFGVMQMTQALDRLTASIDAFSTAANARITDQQSQLDALTQRVTALENTPPAPAGTSDDALNALADKVDGLTKAITPAPTPAAPAAPAA
jgi:hypothetical protein